MNAQPVTIRTLGYSDLPQVISIERRAFPTPWSLAMFVLELSKPSGVCLAAIEDRRIDCDVHQMPDVGVARADQVADHPAFLDRGQAHA